MFNNLTNQNLIIIVGLVAVFVVLYLLKNRSPGYSQRHYLMTKTELKFYKVLAPAVQAEYIVFSKVRIADILKVDKSANKKLWWKAFTKISSKHIDYVLCNKNDLSIACCIELDDNSHALSHRQKRDVFVNNAFAQAGLTLHRIPTRSSYDAEEIRRLVAKFEN